MWPYKGGCNSITNLPFVHPLPLNSTRRLCGVSLLWNGSRADAFQLFSVWELPLTAAALLLLSVTAPVIRSPPQQICKASIFVRWWSTTQQFSTEQIKRDRKSNTDTPLKHPVSFRIKHYCRCWRLMMFHLTSSTKRGYVQSQAWSQQRLSEAVIAHGSVVSIKSCRSRNFSCCSLKRNRWVLMDDRANTLRSHSRTHMQWNPGVRGKRRRREVLPFYVFVFKWYILI